MHYMVSSNAAVRSEFIWHSIIKTDHSRVSASQDFWFDFKKEWIFLLCPLSFILVVFVSNKDYPS